MQSLEPLEQLAVDAFATALETCREEGVELPEEVWAIAQTPEDHVAELSQIAKQYPQLSAAYRTARKLLRKTEGDRNKRLSTDDQSFLKQVNPALEQPFTPLLSPWDKEATPTSISDRTPKPSESLDSPDSATSGDSDTASPSSPIRPVIYRYTLPDTASPQAAIAFSKQVETIRQINPDWVVSYDRTNPGEADAIVLIHKDEHYAVTHSAYLMNQTLNQVVGPALARVFGSTPSKPFNLP